MLTFPIEQVQSPRLDAKKKAQGITNFPAETQGLRDQLSEECGSRLRTARFHRGSNLPWQSGKITAQKRGNTVTFGGASQVFRLIRGLFYCFLSSKNWKNNKEWVDHPEQSEHIT